MSLDSIPLYQAQSTLRAVRRLKADPIPDDVLRRILQAAAWAPSGGNQQPWRIIVVRDAHRRQQIGELYKTQWARFAAVYRSKLEQLSGLEKEREERSLKAADYLGDNMGKAPVLIVFCFNPNVVTATDAALGADSIVGGASVYPAVENLLLACVTEGLGCTLTTLLCLEEPRMKEILAIPQGWNTCAVVPVGYAVGKGHGPISRKPVEELCFADQFGGQFELLV